MITLLEYFNNDFKDLCIGKDLTILQKGNNEQVTLSVSEKVYQDSNSSARLFTYYIPESNITLEIIKLILNQNENRIKELEGVIVIGGFQEDMQIGEHKNTYSKRVYFYVETPLTNDEKIDLDNFCKNAGFYITIRSTDYVNKKMELEKPMAFISHDSRDKDLIARPLAVGLGSRCCSVWYDEYSLKIGDSLRTSIEEGIKNAKKCILILTKNYINNPGWGKKEFNSIFTRELICNEKIVLPIWYDVTKEDIYEYSPSLADTVALIWPEKESLTEREYNEKVQQLISKVHVAITTSNKE